ncbi:MAG: RraA family protein [Acetivibrionales bacterium]|jgi:4-hydroxy-4-methyl-2-oxoglutarate aldolase
MAEERKFKFITDRPPKEIIEKFYELTTCMVSDALDKLGIPGGVYGIDPMHRNCKPIVGPAITMKMVPYGSHNPPGHTGSDPMHVAEPGDILVYDNGGNLEQNCWGDIVTYNAMKQGIIGTIAYGAVRDMGEVEKLNYPVYAMGHTPLTARGRNVQADYNCVVQIRNVQVNPGDLVMADINGVAVIPKDRAEEVLKVAMEIKQFEENMIEEIKQGKSFRDVDKKSGYDNFLLKNK